MDRADLRLMDQPEPFLPEGGQRLPTPRHSAETVRRRPFTRSKGGTRRAVYTETTKTFYSKETGAAVFRGDNGFSGSVQVDPSNVGLPPKATDARYDSDHIT